MSETREWWTAIRVTAFFAAAEQAETEPDTIDPVTIELADWAEHREQLGLGSHGTGDFIGLGDDRSGLPSWQHPVNQPEPEPTPMETYATERAGAGIKTASAVFGASQPQPRRNSSPWSV
jgi:hypothetical protein